jgi:hypothetical protein
LVFVLAQAVYLARYAHHDKEPAPAAGDISQEADAGGR